VLVWVSSDGATALTLFCRTIMNTPPPNVGLAWSNDPESYAGRSVATGRVSLAGQVKGDDPD
jgi:hypothetical protein